MNPLIMVFIFTPIFVYFAVSRNHQKQAALRSRTVHAEVDQVGARRDLADGRREEVAWEEVTEVDIFTARKGPHRDAGGAVVLYGDGERGCIIPLDWIERSGLLTRITMLPGFPLADLVRALGAADPADGAIRANGVNALVRPISTTTVLWTRPAPADLSGDPADPGRERAAERDDRADPDAGQSDGPSDGPW